MLNFILFPNIRGLEVGTQSILVVRQLRDMCYFRMWKNSSLVPEYEGIKEDEGNTVFYCLHIPHTYLTWCYLLKRNVRTHLSGMNMYNLQHSFCNTSGRLWTLAVTYLLLLYYPNWNKYIDIFHNQLAFEMQNKVSKYREIRGRIHSPSCCVHALNIIHFIDLGKKERYNRKRNAVNGKYHSCPHHTFGNTHAWKRKDVAIDIRQKSIFLSGCMWRGDPGRVKTSRSQV